VRDEGVRIQPQTVSPHGSHEGKVLSDPFRVEKRVVIFCSSGAIERIKTGLKAKLDVRTVEYFARLSSEKRMAAIFDFNFKKTKILLTTELASRGFSFLPAIDCIISFDACEKP
jgi:superfamily II DNA/RNA helicase